MAGTYGRGIWISDLPSATLAGDDLKITAVNSPFSLNLLCDDIIPMITVKNNGTNVITDIDVEYTIDGGSPQNHLWSGSLSSLQTTSIDLPTLVLTDGDHSLLINAIITNDSFENNNKRFLSFFKNSQGTIPGINTFEDAQDDLISINLGGSTLWERGVPSGSVLNTTNSGTQVYGTDLSGNHPDQTKAYLYSNCLDLSTISSPVLKFYMAYDIEPDWDLVYVESSIDGGDNWNLLGSASDPNWYNSDRFDGDGLGSDCYNCVGGQWTGTDEAMIQYSYALDAFTSESNFMFRFVFHSDFAVNQEGVIIDDLEIAGTLLSSRDYELSSIAIYPNPSSNIFNVKLVQSADVSYQITDITGKKIIGNKVNNTSHFTINMDHLSTGIYLLTLNSEGNRTTKKLILN